MQQNDMADTVAIKQVATQAAVDASKAAQLVINGKGRKQA